MPAQEQVKKATKNVRAKNDAGSNKRIWDKTGCINILYERTSADEVARIANIVIFEDGKLSQFMIGEVVEERLEPLLQQLLIAVGHPPLR
jgi:hypothetical protein